MQELKPTLHPSAARLWATMAEELPSVTIISDTSSSRSGSSCSGNP